MPKMVTVGMILPSCPECDRPFNRNERAVLRHREILRLWEVVKNASQIARLVGLSHSGDVMHHVDGRCKCEVKP